MILDLPFRKMLYLVVCSHGDVSYIRLFYFQNGRGMDI
jgi:hypothetical protein